MHGTKEAIKIWVVEVSTFEYSHYSKELTHLLSVTLNLIRRFTKRQVPRGGVYGGLVNDAEWSILLVGYPKWKVDANSGKFPLAKMLRFRFSPVGLKRKIHKVVK